MFSHLAAMVGVQERRQRAEWKTDGGEEERRKNFLPLQMEDLSVPAESRCAFHITIKKERERRGEKGAGRGGWRQRLVRMTKGETFLKIVWQQHRLTVCHTKNSKQGQLLSSVGERKPHE